MTVGTPSKNLNAWVLRPDFWKICIVVVANWVAAVSITLLNKQLLTFDKFFVNLPFSVFFIQSLTSIAICTVFIFVQAFILGNAKFTTIEGIFGSVNLRDTVIMSIFSAITLLLSTIILKFYSIALFTTSRTLATVFTVVYCRLLLREIVPFPTAFACALIAAGYFTSIADKVELNNDWRIKNIILSFAAGSTQALSVIYCKKSLPNKEDSVIILFLINNFFYALASLICMMFNGEFEEFAKSEIPWNPMGQVVFSGVLGFIMGYLTRLQVQITSAIAFEIVSSVRLINQAVAGVLIFKESLSEVKIAGIVLVFAGNLLYGWFKARTAMFNKTNAVSPKETEPLITNEDAWKNFFGQKCKLHHCATDNKRRYMKKLFWTKVQTASLRHW